MANDLAIYEQAIDGAMPTLANILAATPGLPARSFKAALLSQMVNSKAANNLAQCTVQSFLNCAATFSGLGLMPDGVTGQAYMLPFKGAATPVIGYKGYNTLGERAGRTIDGDVVRDGDEFDFERGTQQWVRHKPAGVKDARIVRAWAAATSMSRPPLIAVLTIDELEAVRLRSPAGTNSNSPWMDLTIGRPAMYSKTVKRRLARGMPLLHGSAGSYVVADAIEGEFDRTGRPHYLLPGQDGSLHVTDGVTGAEVDIKPPPSGDKDPTQPPMLLAQLTAGAPPEQFTSVDQWKLALLRIIELNSKRRNALQGIQSANAGFLAEASTMGHGEAAIQISNMLKKALDALK